MRYRSAFREDDGEIKVFSRPEVPAWDDFRSSEDAGCLRKLWTLAHQVSKKEVEALATGAEDDQKNKITMATAQELEEEAVRAGGIPPPGSDRDRPSLHTWVGCRRTLGQMVPTCTCLGRSMWTWTMRAG